LIVPYIYNKYDRFEIKTKEDYYFIKGLLDSGESKGSIRYKYHISRRTLEIIEKDLMSFDASIKIVGEEKFVKKIPFSILKKSGYGSLDEYCLKNNCKLLTFSCFLKKSNSARGKKHSIETINILKDKSTGKKHSKETLEKLSKLNSGKNNPATRPDVKKKLKENHISKTNPKRWKEITEKIKEKQTGKKLSPEHLAALARGKEQSSKYGSKAQLYCYEYLRRYFKLFYNIEVRSNDCHPFEGTTNKFTVDISIPQYKIAIEWDGVLHRNPIYGVERLKLVSNMDIAKNALLKKYQWKLIRIKDDNDNGQVYKKFVRQKCRENIPLLLNLISNRNTWNSWENDYPDPQVKINIADFTIPKVGCKTEFCKNLVSIKSKIGLCNICYMREYRKKEK